MSAALLIRAVIGAGAACEAVGTFAQQLIEHEGSWAVKKAQVSGGTTVTIVDNFLPPELAANWYTSLNATWARSAPCREDVSKCVATEEDGNDVCSWLYTTNSRGGNGKIRSVVRASAKAERLCGGANTDSGPVGSRACSSSARSDGERCSRSTSAARSPTANGS
jgi:hypothetical protein